MENQNIQTQNSQNQNNRNQNKKSNKGLFIFLCILVGGILLLVFVSVFNLGSAFSLPFVSTDTPVYEDYVAELYVEGGIYAAPTGAGSYDHEWMLDKIDTLIEDEQNKGIILYVNSPGGEVYVGDELYLKLLEYKEATDRPIYAYFSSQAASGAYYISCAADKIFANRNCITGSIGVKIGTFYDVTELMEEYGVDAFDIASGDHKNMGSYYETMDAEEIAIYQDIVNEFYEQFIGIVAEGRGMDIEKVRKLADGRIYSASQAKELGLIDEIGSFDDAMDAMLEDYDADWETVEMYPNYEYSIYDVLSLFISARSTPAESASNNARFFFLSDGVKPLYY